MKKLVCLLLCLTLLAALCACAVVPESGVTFYYPRTSYIYNREDGVIAAETREASGHLTDVQYLLSLYLGGPMDPELREAFPQGTALLSVALEDALLRVELSDTADTLTDAQYSLACTCLTLTCRELFGAESVTVVSGTRSVTLSGDEVLLYEEPFPTTGTEGTE